MLRRVEAVLERFEPRPHWGKLSSLPADVVRARYERMGSFRPLAERLDPTGMFRNGFVDRVVLGQVRR